MKHPRPMPDKGGFAKLFREYRERLELSQIEIEKETGISHRTLSRWENEKSKPSWDHLQQLVWLAEEHNHYHHLFDYQTKTHDRRYELTVRDGKGILATVATRIAEHDGDVRQAETETFAEQTEAKMKIAVVFDRYPSEVLQELFALPFVLHACEMSIAGSIIEELPDSS